MVRNKTPEDRERWNAYMREYRKRREADQPATERKRDQAGQLKPTDRQLEILRVYVDPEVGGSQDAVAAILGITTNAVHNSLGRLMRRLGVKSPAQAAFKLWVDERQEVPPAPVPRNAPPER